MSNSNSNNMEEISLNIRGQIFKIKKKTLSEHSDYFRAMFSGNYVENNREQISINMLEPATMSIIMKYMEIGLIDLLEYSLPTIGDIAVAANFLQITELIKQIEYTLDSQISECNWMETMAIAENSSYSKLEQLSAAFGLFTFKSMKPEHVPSIHKLAWYLSHPYLDAACELDVFNFGFKWILQNETAADAILVILGCLDVRRLSNHDIEEIKILLHDFENILAINVVECFEELITINGVITSDNLNYRKAEIIEQFTERVWSEVYSIVRESKSRKLEYTPVIPMWLLKDSKPELLPHCLYTYKEKEGFQQWLEVAEKNLWGWNIISWGLTKLIVVCGEHGRGTGIFMRDVKVYDTLRKEWTRHGVVLPQRRHAGIAVVGDSLYLVGGVGGFRSVIYKQCYYIPPVFPEGKAEVLYINNLSAKLVNKIVTLTALGGIDIIDMLGRRLYTFIKVGSLAYGLPDKVVTLWSASGVIVISAAPIPFTMEHGSTRTTAIYWVVLETAGIYDLKQRTYRKIAKFPDAIQYPAVCSHENVVYAAGHTNIYRYEDSGDSDSWVVVVGTEIRMSCLRSYNDYIYCTQSYFSHLYRFRPNVDEKLHLIKQFSNLPATICNLGNRIVVFTRTVCNHSDMLAVEEYREGSLEDPNVLFTQTNTSMRVNDVAGSCVLVLSAPPLHIDMSQYHKRYLAQYNPITQ